MHASQASRFWFAQSVMSSGGNLVHNSSGVPEVVMDMHEVMARL